MRASWLMTVETCHDGRPAGRALALQITSHLQLKDCDDYLVTLTHYVDISLSRMDGGDDT